MVSVVIPVWNQWRLTQRCLDSLARHAEAPLEIVVVDNGSTDDTRKGLAARPDLVVVTNERNLGFPKAVNQGIAAASGEWICVLNNDTEVTPGWLSEQLAALAVPGAGMVGPRSNSISGPQVVPDAPALSEGAVAHAWAEQWSRAHRGVSWPTARLVGFCLLVRRDVLEAVGGFDEGFGIGNYEDDELGQRIMAAGLSLRVADGSIVLHHGGATFRQLGPRLRHPHGPGRPALHRRPHPHGRSAARLRAGRRGRRRGCRQRPQPVRRGRRRHRARAPGPAGHRAARERGHERPGRGAGRRLDRPGRGGRRRDGRSRAGRGGAGRR